MKKLFLALILATSLNGAQVVLSPETQSTGWKLLPDRAQYKEASWDNHLFTVKGISRSKAIEIANEHPEVTFFFWTKGWQMVLENTTTSPQTWRVFQHGDAVYFSGKHWFGTAPGLADAYVKEES